MEGEFLWTGRPVIKLLSNQSRESKGIAMGKKRKKDFLLGN